MQSAAAGAVFYSKLTQTVEALPQAVMTVGQARAVSAALGTGEGSADALLVAAGFTSLGPDGQYFFDTDHPVGSGTASNHMGGAGTAFGAIIGSAFLEVIRNALLMAGIDSNWQGAFVGAFIILAVLLGLQSGGKSVVAAAWERVFPRKHR